MFYGVETFLFSFVMNLGVKPIIQRGLFWSIMMQLMIMITQNQNFRFISYLPGFRLFQTLGACREILTQGWPRTTVGCVCWPRNRRKLFKNRSKLGQNLKIQKSLQNLSEILKKTRDHGSKAERVLFLWVVELNKNEWFDLYLSNALQYPLDILCKRLFLGNTFDHSVPL